jgi:hypothetical protein
MAPLGRVSADRDRARLRQGAVLMLARTAVGRIGSSGLRFEGAHSAI